MLISSILLFAAAQIIEPNQHPVELPVVDPASGRADHCEVAVNDQRDFLVVWHTEYDPVGAPSLRLDLFSSLYDGERTRAGDSSAIIDGAVESLPNGRREAHSALAGN